MTTLNHYGFCAARLDGRRLEGGSIDTPTSITVNGQKEEHTWSVANGTNVTIYANGLGVFQYGYIESDFNTRAVIIDNAAIPNSMSLPIRGSNTAGKYGIGLVLPRGVTVDATTAINSIVVHNESGSTAKVHAIIVK